MKSAAEVVNTMLQAALRQDMATITTCLDPDVICVEPDSLAYGGTARGRDAFLNDVFGAIFGKFEMSIAKFSVIGTTGTVAVDMEIHFKSRKTGLTLIMPYVELYTVKNEKIGEIRVYPQDTKALVEFWNAN
jgi:ketosteroid isomerase-like protein